MWGGQGGQDELPIERFPPLAATGLPSAAIPHVMARNSRLAAAMESKPVIDCSTAMHAGLQNAAGAPNRYYLQQDGNFHAAQAALGGENHSWHLPGTPQDMRTASAGSAGPSAFARDGPGTIPDFSPLSGERRRHYSSPAPTVAGIYTAHTPTGVFCQGCQQTSGEQTSGVAAAGGQQTAGVAGAAASAFNSSPQCQTPASSFQFSGGCRQSAGHAATFTPPPRPAACCASGGPEVSNGSGGVPNGSGAAPVQPVPVVPHVTRTWVTSGTRPQTWRQHFSLDGSGRPFCVACLALHDPRADTPFCSEQCAADWAGVLPDMPHLPQLDPQAAQAAQTSGASRCSSTDSPAGGCTSTGQPSPRPEGGGRGAVDEDSPYVNQVQQEFAALVAQAENKITSRNKNAKGELRTLAEARLLIDQRKSLVGALEGIPAGPFPCSRSRLHHLVNSACEKLGWGASLNQNTARTQSFKCKSHVNGCKWGVKYELTKDGWTMSHYGRHVQSETSNNEQCDPERTVQAENHHNHAVHTMTELRAMHGGQCPKALDPYLESLGDLLAAANQSAIQIKRAFDTYGKQNNLDTDAWGYDYIKHR